MAEYVLLHLLSRVLFVRDLRSVGKVSCNITNFTPTPCAVAPAASPVPDADTTATAAVASSSAAAAAGGDGDVKTETEPEQPKPILPLANGLSAGVAVLYDAISKLVTKVCPIPMHFANISSLPLYPTKVCVVLRMCKDLLWLLAFCRFLSVPL